ncbi:hypothetical protein [Persephonella sp.]
MYFIIICLLILFSDVFGQEIIYSNKKPSPFRDLEINVVCPVKSKQIKYRLTVEDEGDRAKIVLRFKAKKFTVYQKLYEGQKLSLATVDTFDRMLKKRFSRDHRITVKLPHRDIVEVSYYIMKNGVEKIFTPEVYIPGARDRLELSIPYNLRNNVENLKLIKKRLEKLDENCSYTVTVYTKNRKKQKTIKSIFK